MNSAGAVIWLALGSALVALALTLAFGWLARARVRLPAAVWLLPPIGVYLTHWIATLLLGKRSIEEAASTPLDEIAAHGLRASADLLRIEALGMSLTTLLLLATAWIAALSHALSTVDRERTGRYQTSWVHSLLPVLCALPAALLLSALGLWLGATRTGLLLGISLFTGLLALAVASSRRAQKRPEATRLGAARGLIAACTVCAVITLSLASSAMIHADGMTTALALALDERPAHLILTLASAQTAQGLGLLAGGLGLLTGALSLLLTPRALGSWRTLLGAWLALILLLAVPVLYGARAQQLAPLLQITQGGALAEQPEVRLTGLPNLRSLSGSARLDQGLLGSCLVTEHATGWAAGPLYRSMDQEQGILRRAEGPVDPLQRAPGCPPQEGPLLEPFSTHEIPVVLVDSERLAPMLTGHRWFLREGTLRLLLAPDASIHRGDPPAARAWRFRTLPLDWELPPEGPPVGDEGEHWDFEGAASLPVTLLEGPRPLLVAGGSRDYINPDREGAEALRDALLGSEDRRLVLVPRKEWRIRDLAAFCLTAYGQVEGVRCVIRPENPERWSERTGLPLPWGLAPE